MAEESNCVEDNVKKRMSLEFTALTPVRMVRSLPLRRKSPMSPASEQAKCLGRTLWSPSISHNGALKATFGTPSYPSPLDRIRTGKRERAAQLGINVSLYEKAEYETNQSFPGTKRDCEVQKSKPVLAPTLDDFKGDGLNDVSFSMGHQKGSFSASHPDMKASLSLGSSWAFFNYISSTAGDTGTIPTNVRNPNKAICTINARTTEILVTNDMACELFNYGRSELVGMTLNNLVRMKNKNCESMMEAHLEEGTGKIVTVCGKVLDAVDSSGLVIPVSVWIKNLKSDGDPRCLVIMEPVERTTAKVTFDTSGTIISCDSQFAYLHGYTSPIEMMGQKLTSYIPALVLPTDKVVPKEIKKQSSTGRSRDGTRFPCTITIRPLKDNPNGVDAGDLKKILLNKPNKLEGGYLTDSVTALAPSDDRSRDGTRFPCNITIRPLKDNPNGVDAGDLKKILLNKPNKLEGGYLTDSVTAPSSDDRGRDGTRFPCTITIRPLEHNPNGVDAGNLKKILLNKPNKLEGGYLTDSVTALSSSDDRGRDGTRFPCTITIRPLKDNPNGVYAGDLKKILLNKPNKLEGGYLTDSVTALSSSDDRGRDGTRFPCTITIRPLKDNPNGVYAGDLKKILLNKPNKLEGSGNLSTQVEGPTPDARSLDSSVADSSNTSIGHLSNSGPCSVPIFEGIIWVFANISGMVTFLSDGAIHSINQHFSLMLTGYRQQDILGKDVSFLIPDFYEDLDLLSCDSMPLPPIDDDDDYDPIVASAASRGSCISPILAYESCPSPGTSEDMGYGKSMSETTPRSLPSDVTSPSLGINADVVLEDLETTDELLEEASRAIARVNIENASGKNRIGSLEDGEILDNTAELLLPMPPIELNTELQEKDNSKDRKTETASPLKSQNGHVDSESLNSVNKKDCVDVKILGPGGDATSCESPAGKEKLSSHLNNYDKVTSTPSCKSKKGPSNLNISEGSWCGKLRHRDGNNLAIIYQIKTVPLEDGETLYCMWVSRDPEDPAVTYTLASSFNSTLDQSSFSFHKEFPSEKVAPPIEEERQEDLMPFQGQFEEFYKSSQSIGKGAYGFVKLASRNSDGKEVVVKYIKKVKVLKECWLDDPDLGTVPLEVSLLTKLQHPNIVSLLEVFENDLYYQVVMEKHGQGMDLFEFIDRCPNLDEPLVSYMFRQLVSSVSYLHDLSILHRDIKDENIILDQKFNIKLIDFGSAAFIEPGKVFSTFCGTLEYCSPEVLLGNKYRGPELELWSVGITLYTLVFGENPFYDIDETIAAVLKPPFQVSDQLLNLIGWLLQPDPDARATIADLQRNSWVNQPIQLQRYSWHKVLPNSDFHGNTASDNRPESANSPSAHANDSDTEQLANELQKCLELDDEDSRSSIQTV